MKSLAVRPSMGLPFLSFTVTVWTISSVDERNEGCCGGGCVGCWASNSDCVRTMKAMTPRLISESKPERHLDAPHLAGSGRPSELRTGDDAVDRRVRDAIEDVRRIQPPLERETTRKAKDARK